MSAVVIEEVDSVFGEWPETLGFHSCDICGWSIIDETSFDPEQQRRFYQIHPERLVVCERCVEECRENP